MELDEYVLAPDEKAMLDSISSQVRDLQADAQAVLRCITRIKGLQGNWTLADDNSKLTRVTK